MATRMMKTDPEMQSIESLVQYLLDDERETVTRGEIATMAQNLPFVNEKPRPLSEVNDAVLAYAASCGYALKLAEPVRPKVVRGINSWDHNRYAGNECAGGSGHEQIAGWAGQEG